MHAQLDPGGGRPGEAPSQLVRDSGLESFDPPEREAPFDRRTACQKATSSIVRFGSSD
ncbi:MAG TPA: hypothetical protein VMU64_06520 [Acidimicrobiales bacterium]|nr:hypothetical protein [Acidimicrobiales bacterium]